MAETHKIECDECGRDLTYTGNCEDYYLVLGNASKGHHRGSGFYTSMAISPPLKRAHHFCGLDCMDNWRDRQRHRDKLWGKWHDGWREEHGTKDETGRIRSYPCASDDVRKTQEIEIDAAALVAFPRRNAERRGR